MKIQSQPICHYGRFINEIAFGTDLYCKIHATSLPTSAYMTPSYHEASADYWRQWTNGPLTFKAWFPKMPARNCFLPVAVGDASEWCAAAARSRAAGRRSRRRRWRGSPPSAASAPQSCEIEGWLRNEAKLIVNILWKYNLLLEIIKIRLVLTQQILDVYVMSTCISKYS